MLLGISLALLVACADPDSESQSANPDVIAPASTIGTTLPASIPGRNNGNQTPNAAARTPTPTATSTPVASRRSESDTNGVTSTDGSKSLPTPPDEFWINIGDVVKNAHPGPGAGNIESPGVQDIYHFNASPRQQIFFDSHGAADTHIFWSIVDEDGNFVFDKETLAFEDPDETFELTRGGVYTVAVWASGDFTGTYGFQVLNVPPLDEFSINIGDAIADAKPGPGAGNIESPGVQDIYHFNASPGQQIFFDSHGASDTHISWTVADEDGNFVFEKETIAFEQPDKTFELTRGGTYTITVWGESGATDVYGFEIINVPPNNVFTINVGDVVKNAHPGPGAGNIESPGVQDIYHFNATSRQVVFFDSFDATDTHIFWSIADVDGNFVFERETLAFEQPDKTFELTRGGTYTITVWGEAGAIDSYGFQILNVPPRDEFSINIGDAIADAKLGPGAGNIESPGVQDIYHFNASPGQQIFFDSHGASDTHVFWSIVDEDGNFVFHKETLAFEDPDETFELTRGGVYTVAVWASGDFTGTYGFQVLNVPPLDEFSINIGDAIADAKPGPGAGNIESPGVQDIYHFNASPGQQIFFDSHGATDTHISWTVADEGGNVIFEKEKLAFEDPDSDFELALGGVYTITVWGDGDVIGTYSFEIRSQS